MSSAVFDELNQLQDLIEQLGDAVRVETVAEVTYQQHTLPIHCLSLGSTAANVPVIAYFGGVHGLEKIGSEVLMAYLQTLAALLPWDEELQHRLSKLRLLFMPFVNPVGVWRGTRCNGNGVDLMRNAPIDGVGKIKLYSGHRISPHLPWFRGDLSRMEVEAEALCRVVRRELSTARRLIAVDLHSGFGIRDRVWFPYAGSQKPFASLAEAHALKQLFDRSYPHHVYQIEPMSLEYVISGDLWDYLYDEHQRTRPDCLFLPLTLEMGSWLWLRKSPLHLFQRHGLFHPLLPHRQQRILRRHLILFDFLSRAILNADAWAMLSSTQRDEHEQHALEQWYA